MQKYQNRILAGLVIALLIYVVILLVIDNQGQLTGEMAAAFAGYPWLWLVVIAGLHVMAGVFRFLEWQYFLGVIGARRLISLADSAIIMTFGFTMVVSPGKAAELLKAVFLKIKTGVPVSRSAPVIVAERVVDGLAVIVILTVILLTNGDRLNLGDFLPTAQAIITFSAALIVFG
ncbi:MAG TPA: lysylphosphatidylglycerol synthase domain-containing protein, partial [Aggregatilineales bacterium]|nr:lysylphosphatidylglycerol synthase domain-containing protein [Aggregatilineales bacterium]